MIRPILTDWNRFWFSERPQRALLVPRAAICCVAATWFASFLPHAVQWFSSGGILTTPFSGILLEFDRSPGWQNWSPLWLSDNSALHWAWLALGIVLSLLAAGLGGRIAMIVLWFWIVAWAHRITWLQGAVEPALAGATAYLIVAPGSQWHWRVSSTPTARRTSWQAGLALRLLQVQWWILTAAGVMSQMASLIWWRGEGVWWLASAGRSNLFSVEMFRGEPSLTNAVSHAAILVQILALWLVLIASTRRLGIAFGVLAACVYGLVADQLLYGALLGALLTSFATGFSADRPGDQQPSSTADPHADRG